MKIEKNTVTSRSADAYTLSKRINQIRSDAYNLYMSFTRRKLRENGLITDSFSQELPVSVFQHATGISSRDTTKSFKRLGSIFTKNLEKEMPFIQGLKVEFVNGKSNSLVVTQVELLRWMQVDRDEINISEKISLETTKHLAKWNRYLNFLNKKAIKEQLPIRFTCNQFIAYEPSSGPLWEGILYLNIACQIAFWFRKDWVYGELDSAGNNTGKFMTSHMKISKHDGKILGQDLNSPSGNFHVNNFDEVPEDSKFVFDRNHRHIRTPSKQRIVIGAEASVWASSNSMPVERYPYFFPKFSTVERIFNYLPEFKKILKTLARKLSYVPETFYIGDFDISEP